MLFSFIKSILTTRYFIYRAWRGTYRRPDLRYEVGRLFWYNDNIKNKVANRKRTGRGVLDRHGDFRIEYLTV